VRGRGRRAARERVPVDRVGAPRQSMRVRQGAARREGARARGRRRRAAREHARVKGGSGPGGRTRASQGAARSARARACGRGRHAARDHARVAGGGEQGGSTRAWPRAARRERACARGRGRRTGREHASAAEGGEQGGSTRARQREARRERARKSGVAPSLARPPQIGGSLSVTLLGAILAVGLPLVAAPRVTRRRRGVGTADVAAWRTRGRRGRRDVPPDPRRRQAPAARSASHAGFYCGAIDCDPLVHVQ